jgi:hypothetical protein
MKPSLLYALCILICGCAKDWIPVYSACPGPHIDPPDIEQLEQPELAVKFRYPPDPSTQVITVISNGWYCLMGLPELDNYDEVTNAMVRMGYESRYENKVLRYRPFQP